MSATSPCNAPLHPAQPSRLRGFLCALGVAPALCLTPSAAHAQFTRQAPTGQLQDLALLKPPTGSKVAVVVFEDLGCPHCAAAHPIELEVCSRYHVPLVRYDAPIRSHIWTFQGAVNARYIQEKLSPQLAEAYRGDVFRSQMQISSLEDLQQFTQTWLQHHAKGMPMLIDPDGSLARQINADLDLGRKINVGWTPTILVVSRDKQQVICGANGTDGRPEDIAPVVQAALEQTAGPHPAAKPHNR